MLLIELGTLLIVVGTYVAINLCLANYRDNERDQAAQLPFAEEPDRLDALCGNTPQPRPIRHRVAVLELRA